MYLHNSIIKFAVIIITIKTSYFYFQGVIDQSTYLRGKQIVKNMSVVIDNNEFMRALKLDSILFTMLHRETPMLINFNNINQVSPYPALDKLEIKVNKYVKPALSHVVNQSLHWEYRSDVVYENLYPNFFVPSTKFCKKYYIIFACVSRSSLFSIIIGFYFSRNAIK